ncbi:BspA family leucine-rich repeat surface protein [Schaalia turicensis]
MDADIIFPSRGINTSRVESMYAMFLGASKANPDVSNWDTRNVRNMKRVFFGTQLANPDVSKWDV